MYNDTRSTQAPRERAGQTGTSSAWWSRLAPLRIVIAMLTAMFTLAVLALGSTPFQRSYAATPAPQQKTVALSMAHLKAGTANGNGHFGSAQSEAFVLSNTSGINDSVSARVILASQLNVTRFRFVNKYVNDNNWSWVAYDTVGSNWIWQSKINGKEKWSRTISGLPRPVVGQPFMMRLWFSTNGNLNVTINGSTATINDPAITQLHTQQGKVGFGAATFHGNVTDLYVDHVAVNGSAADLHHWQGYHLSAAGYVWNPQVTYNRVIPAGKLWLTVGSGPNNGNGHAYGNPNAHAPALLIDEDVAVHSGDTVRLTLNPLSNENYGIFYAYKDTNNWAYIGYDTSSGWYAQYNNNGHGTYSSFSGVNGIPANTEAPVSITVSREAIALSVGAQTAQLSMQGFGDTVKAIANARPGVKVNGASSAVKFSDFAVQQHNAMEDAWVFAADRVGQHMDSEYVNVGTVQGKVTNQAGQPISNATVNIRSSSVHTAADGTYHFDEVTAGNVSVTAFAPGYQPSTQQVTVTNTAPATANFTLEPRPQVDLSQFATISSPQMRVYVGKQFPQIARYVLTSDPSNNSYMRGTEQALTTVAINGTTITPESHMSGSTSDSATYDLTVKGSNHIDLTMQVTITVKDNAVTWKMTNLTKNPGCADIATIAFPGLNFATLDSGDGGTGFAGANRSTDTHTSGDRFITFDHGFSANSTTGFAYGFLSNTKTSAGVFSNSQAEGDKRLHLVNGLDSMGLQSAPWYYERGDSHAQAYGARFRPAQLPSVTVAVAGDLNHDKVIDWNDGAIALRPVMHKPFGWQAMKNLVNYRVVMNFGSEVENPYSVTADNIKKVYLATDGLPGAVILKGYGNEGHDSANSEYADIATKEGGVQGLRNLIHIAHDYGTQVGIHVNAQEAYPESRSFNPAMILSGNGWGWLDQSRQINKLWDLQSGARWKRFVQLYDRLNGTHHYSGDWDKGQYVKDSQGTVDVQPGDPHLLKEAEQSKNNLDFIYLDVWYQDAWETREIAHEINSLNWRFSSEFPSAGEYDSTWSHWATDAPYGGAKLKGLNSDIIRFLRNSQRDISVLNYPQYGGAADNPLLGGYHLYGFEGWGGDDDFNRYIRGTFEDNLPTRWLQHYEVTKWQDYPAGQSPVGNHEREITLSNKDGDTVVVERHETQRHDTVIERVISLNGIKVLDDGAYLLPWTDTADHEVKLYHYNVDGGSTTWQLPNNWVNKKLALYRLTDTGRVDASSLLTTRGPLVTINAQAQVPYVLVLADKDAAPTLKVTYGELTHVQDPGFNAYRDGQKLDAKVWSGSIDDPSVSVRKASTGDQRLVIQDPAKDIRLSTTLRNLKPHTPYVAELYVASEGNVPSAVSVEAGNKAFEQPIGQSVLDNYVNADPKHYNYTPGQHMIRAYIPFTIDTDATTAQLVISRKAGAGRMFIDNIRIVESQETAQQTNGSLSNGFEHAVSGFFPFYQGRAEKGGDAVTHLSQLNAPYTQRGWSGKLVDDVITGNWSLKHHGRNGGIIYQTTPQSVRFAPGVTYRVQFDYQTATRGYSFVQGDGAQETAANRYEKDLTGDIQPTRTKGTQHMSVEVTGADNGLTWIGLFERANEVPGSGPNGEFDFILDNFSVTPLTDTPARKQAYIKALMSQGSAMLSDHHFTDETAKALKDTMAKAQTLLSDPAATSDKLDESAAALIKATDSLRLFVNTPPTTPVTPTKPGEPTPTPVTPSPVVPPVAPVTPGQPATPTPVAPVPANPVKPAPQQPGHNTSKPAAQAAQLASTGSTILLIVIVLIILAVAAILFQFLKGYMNKRK